MLKLDFFFEKSIDWISNWSCYYLQRRKI